MNRLTKKTQGIVRRKDPGDAHGEKEVRRGVREVFDAVLTFSGINPKDILERVAATLPQEKTVECEQVEPSQLESGE